VRLLVQSAHETHNALRCLTDLTFELGISFKSTSQGLQVTALKKGCSAAEELQSNDLITTINDEIVVGLSVDAAMDMLAGPGGSTVELTGWRTSKGSKQRIECTVVRDVASARKEGVPGVTVKLVSGGLSISKVHEGTSAKFEGLLAGDLIIMIDDDFVCGMPLEQAMDLLSGESGTTVELTVTRVEGQRKKRESFQTVRDFNLKPLNPARDARRTALRAAAIAEREKLDAAAQIEGARAAAESQQEATKAKQAASAAAARAPPTASAATSVLQSTRRQVPLFVPSLEEIQRKKKMYKAGAQVGIVYKQHEKGLLITGFVSGSDASKSELRVGDVIVQVEENFLAGLPAPDAFELMAGGMLAPVELTVSRQVKNVTNRLVTDIIRDVPNLPRKASVGFDFKVEAQGVRVVKVHEKTR